MIRPENRRQWAPKTAELTLAAALAATYIITTFIPLTPFIGGPRLPTLRNYTRPLNTPPLRPHPPLTPVFPRSLGRGPCSPPFYPNLRRPLLLRSPVARGLR